MVFMFQSILILRLIGMLAILIIPRDEIRRLYQVGLEWSVFTLTGPLILLSYFDGEVQFKVGIQFE